MSKTAKYEKNVALIVKNWPTKVTKNTTAVKYLADLVTSNFFDGDSVVALCENIKDSLKPKNKKTETTFFTLDDIVKGYLSLKYGCAIITKAQSNRWPSYTNYMSDGIPFLTFKESNVVLGREAKAWIAGYAVQIMVFNGNKVSDKCEHACYSLEEIKKLLMDDLKGKKPKFKKYKL